MVAKKKWWVLALPVFGVVGVVWIAGVISAQIVQNPGCLVPNSHEFGSASSYVEEGYSYTLEETQDAVVAYAKFGTPLPPGIVVDSIGPQTKVTKTGVTLNMPGGVTLNQILVTVLEDKHTDLELVELYIDGQLVFSATRNSGAIVDNTDGSSLASLTAMVDLCAVQSAEIKIFDNVFEEKSASLAIIP